MGVTFRPLASSGRAITPFSLNLLTVEMPIEILYAFG